MISFDRRNLHKQQNSCSCFFPPEQIEQFVIHLFIVFTVFCWQYTPVVLHSYISDVMVKMSHPVWGCY